jgi:AcrR family transcriptional regulator
MSPPRARALDDGSDLRAHLIEVTERLLTRGGLEGLTTRRIARAAGVADGVLYNHFADKDDLILAAMLARATAVADDFERSCPQPGSSTLESNVALLAQSLLTVQRAVLPLLGGLIGNRALLGRFIAQLHAALGGPDRILNVLHEYLEAERQLSRIGSDAPVHLIGILLFAITQLQALVTQLQAPDASVSMQSQALAPFVSFLVEALHRPT